MLTIGLAGAFLGGVRSLLSPCSSLLLPAFFAYAFQGRQQLLGRTLVFLLGLCTLMLPLGMGSALAARLLIGQRDGLILIAGAVLILLGLLELTGRGFALLPQRLTALGLQGGHGWLPAYVTGLVYGFGGFCAGPLLGGVLTVAAGTGQPWQGALLLFAYALGMATPLFLLAALWDRYQLGRRRWLRGRAVQIGPLTIHSFNLIAGLLFLLLGAGFIVTGGTGSVAFLYESLGLESLSNRLQEGVFRVTPAVPEWLALAALLLAAVALVWWVRRPGRSDRNM